MSDREYRLRWSVEVEWINPPGTVSVRGFGPGPSAGSGETPEEALESLRRTLKSEGDKWRAQAAVAGLDTA